MNRYIFTIRDLLWLMVVVGMAIAWNLADRERQTLKAANTELKKYNSHMVDLIERVWANANTKKRR